MRKTAGRVGRKELGGTAGEVEVGVGKAVGRSYELGLYNCIVGRVGSNWGIV